MFAYHETANDTVQQRRVTGELWLRNTNHAAPVCCSDWFGVLARPTGDTLLATDRWKVAARVPRCDHE